jgi:hypothetical protein
MVAFKRMTSEEPFEPILEREKSDGSEKLMAAPKSGVQLSPSFPRPLPAVSGLPIGQQLKSLALFTPVRMQPGLSTIQVAAAKSLGPPVPVRVARRTGLFSAFDNVLSP